MPVNPTPTTVVKPPVVDDASKNKKLSLGLGLGAGVVMLMGAPILLPLAALGGAAYFHKKSRHSCMTPARQQVYEAALKDLKDPVKLKSLADEFDKEGCAKEANMLRKRANLRELPLAQQKARRQVFKTAIKSTNINGVEAVASAFEGEGATGAAEALRIHAAALKSL